MNQADYIKSYCRKIASGFAALEQMAPQIDAAAAAVAGAVKAGNKVLLCGNGGSAADAQHIAAELMGRFKKERKALAALALTTDTSALTAIANDYEFSEIFVRQIEGLSTSGDVLIALSTSGNSENIIKAAVCAKERAVTVIALTGQKGGALAPLSDHALQVPSDETSHIQEMHIAVGHMICSIVESAFE